MGLPKLSTMIIYITCMLVFWIGGYLLAESGWKSAAASALILGSVAMGFVFLIGAGISGWNYLTFQHNERMFERRRWEAITPAEELARAIAVLRPDQTALLPMARFGAEIGVVATGGNPEYYLLTPFMNIPLVWVDEYVNELCTRVELYPVSRFASESLEQRYAQAFTAWVTQPHLHLAFPANGPNPATWMNPHARDRCVEFIWGRQEED